MHIKMIIPVLGLILLAGIGICGCGGNRELSSVTADESIPKLQELVPADDEDSPDGSAAATELVALADTREEAEEIAELYGIELSAYSYGVATYTAAGKNIQELMALGEENGYPTLTINHESELHTEP